ncbi:6-phosphogluconate dehydrogenase, partial [Neisseria gonorrhoeae]
YEGFARLFEHIAADVQGQGTEAAQLVAFAERCKAKT